MRSLKRTGILISILLLAGAASAQTYSSFEDEMTRILEGTRFRLGPLRIFPALQIRDLGYDDNVYYLRGEGTPVTDYMGTLSPEIKAFWLLGRSMIFSLTENPEYTHYLNEKRLRTFTNSYSSSLRLRIFHRFALSGEYHFARHFRRAFSEFDRQVTDTRKGFTLGFFLETPRRTALGLTGTIDRYGYEEVSLPDYVAVLSESLNRKDKTGSVEFYYRLFSESIFFFKVGGTSYEFDSPSSAWKNSHSYQVQGGLRFPLLGRARGVLSLGYKEFLPESGGRKGFSGLVGDTDLDFRLGRLGLRARYARDIRFSYWEGAFFYVDSLWGGGVSFYFTRFLRADYNYQGGAMDYPEPFPLPGSLNAFIHRKDTNRNHSIGLVLRIYKTAGLALSYNFFKWTSTLPDYNLDKNSLGASLTYNF